MTAWHVSRIIIQGFLYTVWPCLKFPDRKQSSQLQYVALSALGAAEGKKGAQLQLWLYLLWMQQTGK